MYRFYTEVLLKKLISMGRIPENILMYFWNEEFIQKLKTEEIDNLNTGVALTLYDVFGMGLNIGTCGLTSRYVMKMLNDYKNAKMIYGSCDALKGTKQYFDTCQFPHVWIEYPNINVLIDTTLMLRLPKDYAYKVLKYETRRILADESAAYFDDCDEYHDFPKILMASGCEKKQYYNELLKVK